MSGSQNLVSHRSIVRLVYPLYPCRAKQTLVKMALEPEWEAKLELMVLDLCHDAIEAIFDVLKRKTAYVLDADISGCFDNINHNKLLEKLNTTPTLKKIIRGWLGAGVMEDGKLQSTKRGTIQGGHRC